MPGPQAEVLVTLSQVYIHYDVSWQCLLLVSLTCPKVGDYNANHHSIAHLEKIWSICRRPRLQLSLQLSRQRRLAMMAQHRNAQPPGMRSALNSIIDEHIADRDGGLLLQCCMLKLFCIWHETLRIPWYAKSHGTAAMRPELDCSRMLCIAIFTLCPWCFRWRSWQPMHPTGRRQRYFLALLAYVPRTKGLNRWNVQLSESIS